MYDGFQMNDVVFIILYSKMAKVINPNTCRRVSSSIKSGLEAHAVFFRLLMKGIFDPSVPFDRNLIS